jgi:hypothetical protein
MASSMIDSTTGNLNSAGQCMKCGNAIFLGITHHCPTMPNMTGIVAGSDSPKVPDDLSKRLQHRIDGQREWLLKSNPFVFQEQKHLNEGSVERIYWHYGYSVALIDVLRLVQELEAKLASLEADNERIIEERRLVLNKVAGLEAERDFFTSQVNVNQDGVNVASAIMQERDEAMAKVARLKQPVSDEEWTSMGDSRLARNQVNALIAARSTGKGDQDVS